MLSICPSRKWFVRVQWSTYGRPVDSEAGLVAFLGARWTTTGSSCRTILITLFNVPLLAPLTFTSWNQMSAFVREIDGLRSAA